MKHFSLLTIIGFLILSNCCFSQSKIATYLADPNSGQREHPVDMEKLSLDVSFIPEKGIVKGKVTHLFQMLQDSVDTLFFDGPKITIKEAFLNGSKIKFDTNASGIIVRFSPSLKRTELMVKGKKTVKSDSITFIYEATPAKGIYFIGWNSHKNSYASAAKNFCEIRKQIWTQGQGVDNRYWIPMYDDMGDKMITETNITFDKDYKVLSNGTKVSESSNPDGTKTWHYKMTHPHAGYLLMIGIGKYDIKTARSASGIPMNYYYYPEFPEREQPTYLYSEKMMDFLEAETGMHYPWESYSQIPVQDFIYGAMENTTATIFGDFLCVDKMAFNDRSYVAVNAHEMTHQWFGDFVTARSGSNSWLQEGFATHYAKHFRRTVYGEDEFQWDRRSEMNAVLGASKSDHNPLVHSRAGGRVYPKGSLVLDMMRYVLGDEQYKRGLNLYLKKNAYQNVDTHEFQMGFQDALGINLDWFCEEWMYKGGEPQYEVSYRNIVMNPEQLSTPVGQTIFTYSGQQTEITVEQTHTLDEFTGLFKMPVVFRIHYKDGTFEDKKEIIEKQHQVISFPNPLGKETDFVLFDPGNKILKTVVFAKPLFQLRAQALRAKDMIDRYDAVVAMRDSSVENKRDILTEIFFKEKFYAVKTEILSQLGEDENPKTESLFIEALNDIDLNVRIGAVQKLKKISPRVQRDFEKALEDSSYEMIYTALEKLSVQYPARVSYYMSKTQNLYGSGNNIRIKWIELSALGDQNKHIQELVEMAGNGYEFRTRVNAMNALQRINYLDETAMTNIFDAVLSKNSRLSNPASDVLNYFYKQTTQKQAIQKFYKSKTWTDKEREKLDKYKM